jgi:N-acetylmuramoyl-L-alanine amidase
MTGKPILQGKAGYQVREVILHTSATNGDWHDGKTVDQMRAEIDRWHRVDRGWRKIGYHAVIAPDGSFAQGRAFTEIGAHVAERNRGTIGICMIPVATILKMGNFEDFYTPAQRSAVRNLIKTLPGILWVTGHNDYAPKLCPGFKVQDADWLP